MHYICTIDNENNYLIPEDMDPIDIEYDVEIVAAERDEQQNNEYAHYNSK